VTTTSSGGSFNLTYRPTVAGNWTIVAEWASDSSLYSSASSNPILMEVTAAAIQPAIEYVYVVVMVLVVISVALLGYTYFKRAKK
jgi:hypothetical protein